MTEKWDGLTKDGKPYNFTKARALKLYRDPAMSAVALQVASAIYNTELYTLDD
jgi:hypothetical protein